MNKTEARVAIIGGGEACRDLIDRIRTNPQHLGLKVLGVADGDPEAPGLRLARELGVPLVTSDYHDFLNQDGIDLLIDLSGSPEVREEICHSLPDHMHFIDHFSSRLLWDFLALANERDRLHRQTEDQVATERNRLRNILDSLPYEILVINVDYRVELANRTFLANNRLEDAQVLGRHCYDLDHRTKGPCDITLEGCPHARSLQNGKSVATVVVHADEEGKERFAAVRAAPIRDEDGKVLGVVEAIRDITQRVRTEEELKETRARLDQFIDSAPLFIYMKNANLQYRVINQHALDALGRTEAEVVGKTDFDLFPEAVARQIRIKELEVLRAGHKVQTEGELPLPDRKINFNATLFPVRKDDEVVGLFGLIEDTTELHKSEEQLHREQEQHFEARKYLAGILENSRDMIFLTNPQGFLLSFNAGAEKVLGYDADSVLGQSIAQLAVDPQHLQELFDEALNEGHSLGYELPLRRKDGEQAVCNVSLTLINAPDGSPLEVVGICRDLTTRLRLQQDLVQADRLAAIGKMAAGVAHEINNPLAVIDTIAGVIEETIADEKDNLDRASQKVLIKAAERLRYQTRRCTTITHSLLGFARKSKSGQIEVEVTELLDESLTLLASEISDAGVEIRRNYAPDLPLPVTDPMYLEQVFVNLLKNAFDAVEEKGTGHGIVEITTRQRDNWYEIAIEDTGIGIPKQALDKIFDLFHTSKPTGKGTGLGLAIVRDIMNRLGGEIHVASEEGHWTRFTISLPLGESLTGPTES